MQKNVRMKVSSVWEFVGFHDETEEGCELICVDYEVMEVGSIRGERRRIRPSPRSTD